MLIRKHRQLTSIWIGLVTNRDVHLTCLQNNNTYSSKNRRHKQVQYIATSPEFSKVKTYSITASLCRCNSKKTILQKTTLRSNVGTLNTRLTSSIFLDDTLIITFYNASSNAFLCSSCCLLGRLVLVCCHSIPSKTIWQDPLLMTQLDHDAYRCIDVANITKMYIRMFPRMYRKYKWPTNCWIATLECKLQECF